MCASVGVSGCRWWYRAGMQSCVAVCGAVWPWRGRGRGLRRAVVVSWLKFAMLSVVGSGFVPNISY